MNAATRTLLIDGPAGAIDLALDLPAGDPAGVAVIAHPHPLFGGTRDNKVVQTLARALVALGFVAWRPNFRGVGKSAGSYDEGVGETEDLLAVVRHAREQAASIGLAHPRLVLAGFSFGSFVQSKVAARLRELGEPADRLVLVGTAVSRFDVEPVPPDTLVVHGEIDDTVPLQAVFDWARRQDLPVVVLPGADHFFHRKLTLLKRIVLDAFGAPAGTFAQAAPEPTAPGGRP
ncbi:MAG: alpha/beta hydrolase [Burkholderiaceae bacterium]|jgi:alpha/beta superfamily hydrolase|nr:alpha/beta hydrolase [Burkholderiaceae bacterium]